MKGSDIADRVSVAPHGKGLVVAVGDPWLYNEYLDGRRLPAEYDNFPMPRATWVKWLERKERKHRGAGKKMIFAAGDLQ